MLGKIPTSVQNAIMLAQKKDAEIHIIKSLHNHDSGHKVNTIYPKQNNKQINKWPCHACNGLHLIKDYNESTCIRCKPNLDDHTQSDYPRRFSVNKQQNINPFYNTDNSTRNRINVHIKPNLQLSISTNKPDHMDELLKATRKMTKYFKKSYVTCISLPLFISYLWSLYIQCASTI